MKLGRRVALVGLIVVSGAALAVVPVSTGEAQQPSQNVLDISLSGAVLDLSITVGAIDGSISDTVSPTSQKVTIAADVLFAFNEAVLTPAAAALIATTASSLRGRGGPIRIDGYTDSVGDPAYNQDLSQRRAEAVRNALAPLLPAGTPIVVMGHGASDPVAPNTLPSGADNPEGRAMNRRVTITTGR